MFANALRGTAKLLKRPQALIRWDFTRNKQTDAKDATVTMFVPHVRERYNADVGITKTIAIGSMP